MNVPWNEVYSFLYSKLGSLMLGGAFAAGIIIALNYAILIIVGSSSNLFFVGCLTSVFYGSMSAAINLNEKQRLILITEGLNYLIGTFYILIFGLFFITAV